MESGNTTLLLWKSVYEKCRWYYFIDANVEGTLRFRNENNGTVTDLPQFIHNSPLSQEKDIGQIQTEPKQLSSIAYARASNLRC